MGSLTSPDNDKSLKMHETGPTVYSPYTICRSCYKGSTFSSVILRPWVLVRSGAWTRDLPHSRLVLQQSEQGGGELIWQSRWRHSIWGMTFTPRQLVGTVLPRSESVERACCSRGTCRKNSGSEMGRESKIENNTWARGDMEFIFECSHWYRTSERSERVRYQMWTREDIFHISKRPCIILFII